MAAFEIERPFLAVPGPRLRSSAASRIGAALVLATVVVLTAQLLPSQRARGHGTPQPRGSGKIIAFAIFLLNKIDVSRFSGPEQFLLARRSFL